MTEPLPVAIYDSSVLVGLVREQLRVAPASPNWQPGLGDFPPATLREPNHDAVAAARLSIPDTQGVRALPVEVVISKRSLRSAVGVVADLVRRSPHAGRAQAVADSVAMTIVLELRPCIVNELTDAQTSERDEIAAQAKVRPDRLVVVSNSDLALPGVLVITPSEWRATVLQLLR